jgi:magnesium transporter
MDTIRDKIEDTEDLLIDEPEKNHIQEIHMIKKRIVYLRKYISSLNKAVNALMNNDTPFPDEDVKIYIRDVYDHTVHINEALVTSKDLQTTLLEMNMANVSNSMNRVMKTLTIVATIFIPLTFLVGIYGMNFRYMPELQWKYGYPTALGAMITIVIIMVIFMKRKKWF